MCGIVGYIGNQEVVPILLSGLQHLEYRGYDSAGIACLDYTNDSVFVAKEKGKLAALKNRIGNKKVFAHVGIGHTRWATHGAPSQINAHPHLDQTQKLALVHNGIIENYAVLKKELIQKGYRFRSETDTEVAVNLISYYYGRKKNLTQAFREALKRLQGFFAFALIHLEEPDKLYVFKRSNPLVVGLGQSGNFVASDVPAFLTHTRKVLYLEDDEVGVIEKSKIKLCSLGTGATIRRKPTFVTWNVAQAAKGGHAHFMLKEIYEQPEVVEATLSARLKKGQVYFDSINKKTEQRLKKIKQIHFVSCGTAYHAGLVGNYMLSEYAQLPVDAAVSSEFRYQDPIVGPNDLVILITQSGETADTLAALREAKAKKAFTLAIVNVVGSTIAREADAVIYTHAGPEIGVASTKAYLAQLSVLALFALYMGQLINQRKMNKQKVQQLIREFKKLPRQIQETLKQDANVLRCAKALRHKEQFLYLGRGYNFPNALEGALKLKEITYAHAHGYAAGEMKHGPIALVDKNQPVICLAPQSKTYDKMLSNIEEIKARSGIIISVSTQGDKNLEKLIRYNFSVPRVCEMLSPILTVIPLQLLAYHIAVLKKRDVDQPRNLAKSVTVE